jgi:heme oxygenase (biliverdin-IX-beta and delta-forming)
LADLAPQAFSRAATTQSLRHALRCATAGVHARLHLHAGLAAVAAERIDIGRYRRLLLRLYGFYLPFEQAAGLEPTRSGWLASDLVALALPEWRPSAAICAGLPRLDSPMAVLGAMYVVEGSALGGRGLAQHLTGLLGDGSLAGRRFFASDGADTGRAWRAYIDRLDTVTEHDWAVVIDAAIATFGCFETWMDGWEAGYNA